MDAGMGAFVEQLNATLSAELGKNITLTSPLSTGLVPFDLIAPSRLLYPVYSPLRNRFPRTQGQGTSRRWKAITAVSGSHTGQAIKRISIPELVQNGGSLSNWPNNLPGSGAQTANDANIPYKFFGLSEALSWLAQFSGQGFEDVAALANLILLQEVMMGEEFQMLSGTGTALSAPGTVTLAGRAAGSNETAWSVTSGNTYVAVTALNLYGETVASSTVNVANASGHVIDVTIPAVKGAAYYRIYAGTGTADPGNAGYFLQADNVGGVKFTLQGTAKSSGSVPPTADTGTSSSNDYEGIWSILSGHAAADASVYPTNWQGGYVNQAIGTQLTNAALQNAFIHLWDGTATSMEGFRANPVELQCEGSDAKRLADSILAASGAQAAYRIAINEGEVGGVRLGAAVSEVQNSITRSVVAIEVHPWFPQGTAQLMSYQLPQAFSNVGNVWENVMVQDYLSINWPVIDASYRYSIFFYGSLICYAPMYCGLLQGLQVADTTPYS